MHEQIEEWEGIVETRAVATTSICAGCVTDPHLWGSVDSEATSGVCVFCSESRACVTFNDLEAVVARTVGAFFVSAEESGAYHDEGEWSERVEDIQEIVEDLLRESIENDALAPLVQYVAGQNAVAYGFVSKRDIWANLSMLDDYAWHQFLEAARSGGPHSGPSNTLGCLNSETRELLERVVTVMFNSGMFQESKPSLWRGRPGDEASHHVDAPSLGTAPAGMAAAGRLNVEGHSCFYGSTTRRGAVIELMKHSGANAEFWVGRFTPSRTVYHLDVFAVPDDPSPFAPDAADTRDALDFLRRFAKTISQPNDPADKEHYRPTQIFTAYLLARYDAPEAIRFASSVEPTSENWVLFVDNDHCVNVRAEGGLDLFMILADDSVEHVTTSDLSLNLD